MEDKFGQPCAGACGIFCLRRPGVYKLEVGLPDLHQNDKTGFLWTWSFIGKTSSPAVAVEDEESNRAGPFDVHEQNAGPGHNVTCYLVKKDTFDHKARPTLTPSDASAAVAALSEATQGKGKGKAATRVLKIVEKRLDANLWRIECKNYKGSHFPSCSSPRTRAGAAPTPTKGAA